MKTGNRLRGLFGRVLACAALSALAVLLLSVRQPAAADSLAMNFESAPVAHEGYMILGWTFTTNSSITVTGLGYYDYQQDGFATGHQVGIFDSQGTLLTSAYLSPGTDAGLDGFFRYVSIVPVTLSAGQTFIVAGTTGGDYDLWAYGNGDGILQWPATVPLLGLSADSRIAIDPEGALYQYDTSGVLKSPANHYGNYTIYAGPNFVIASVPLPSSLLLLIPGFLGLVGMRRGFSK